MMMKKCAGVALALLVAVSCALPISAKVSAQAENAPTLSIGYNGKTQNASRNTFRWNNGRDAVTAVGQSPLAEGRELPVFTRIRGIDTVGLSFSYKPKTVTVNRWSAAERGKTTAQPVTETLSGSMITLPTADGSYIYEVFAQWDEGDARFAFEIATRLEDGLSSAEKLPKIYTPALAIAAADLVLYGNTAQNIDRLTAFVAKHDAKMPAVLRVAVFEDENTVTLYDLHYNGKNIRCVIDNTRGASDGSGLVSVATYDGIFVEDRADSVGNYALTAIGLRVGGGSRAIGDFVKPTISIHAVPTSVLENDVSVSIELANNTDGATLSYDMAFSLDRLTADGWKALPLNGSVAKVEGILKAGEKVIERLPLSRVSTPITAGVYRVGKDLVYDGGVNPAYTEFVVLEQQLPLELGSPQSIKVNVGNGKTATEVTLTRQGKYGTSSPLVYATAELAKFEPLPRDARLALPTDTAQVDVTLVYADSSTMRLTLEPNVSMTIGERQQTVAYLSHGGQDFVADSAVYDNLQKCAISIGGKPAKR